MNLILLALSLVCCAPAQTKDIMDRSFITPERIVWTDGGVSFSELLLREGNGQPDMVGGEMCSMKTGSSIILDYGKELHGGLKLVLKGRERYPKLVRVRFGESVGETCSEPCDTAWLMGHSTNDHAIRDFTLKVPRDGSIEIGNTGFRFVRLDMLEPDSELMLREATAILRYRDIPYRGSFRCSDPLLDKIWQTGAWTVHLNMQEYLWDGIKRDRLIWLGDMHPEMSTIKAVFGYNDVVDRSIDLACEQFPLPGWLNGMSAYSMWYLIIQHDWYLHNGNLEYLEKHRGYITGLIDRISAGVDENGTETLAPWRFLDWPSSSNSEGVEAGYRALLTLSMSRAAVLCRWLGDKVHEQKSLDVVDRLRLQVKPHNNLKQAAALLSLAGLMNPRQACDEVVAEGGAEGFSTFYGYYMLEALAKAGLYDKAIDIIREYWGGMIALGATSFWEDFDLKWAKDAAGIDEMTPPGKRDVHGEFGAYCYPSYRHSLCHGWASGPTAWMSEHILGVEILEPGCRTVRIRPHLGDLDWAEGSYPTPAGDISIRHEKRPDGTVATSFTAPEGVTVITDIPANYDESLAGDYKATLPDLLRCADGRKVRSARVWEEKRRPEILKIMEDNQFGRAPEGVVLRSSASDDSGLGGRARRRQVSLYFSPDDDSRRVDLLMYLPKDAEGPVPVLLNLSFMPCNLMVDDPGVVPGRMWDRDSRRMRQIPGNAGGRGLDEVIGRFLAEGIGFATLCYTDIEPDFQDAEGLGVRGLFPAPSESPWGAISAWAWGVSRVMDYFEKDPDVDADRIALTGCSRLGKTTLWAAASDRRVAAVIASCSGEGGAALSRRNFGETVAHLTQQTRFPYQFTPRYSYWGDRSADEMPMDSHMLISLIAPRPLLLQTGSTDTWSDAAGEFYAAVEASPVYRLLGAEGLSAQELPECESPVYSTLGYVMHEGGHGVMPQDWDYYLEFLRRHLVREDR